MCDEERHKLPMVQPILADYYSMQQNEPIGLLVVNIELLQLLYSEKLVQQQLQLTVLLQLLIVQQDVQVDENICMFHEDICL